MYVKTNSCIDVSTPNPLLTSSSSPPHVFFVKSSLFNPLADGTHFLSRRFQHESGFPIGLQIVRHWDGQHDKKSVPGAPQSVMYLKHGSDKFFFLVVTDGLPFFLPCQNVSLKYGKFSVNRKPDESPRQTHQYRQNVNKTITFVL